MDDDALYRRAITILDDPNAGNEEDRMEAVEDLVRNERSQICTGAELERLVLDILWDHRTGKKPRAKVVGKKVTQQVKLPDPSIGWKPSGDGSKKKGKQQKWIRLDDLPESGEDQCVKSDSPYELLRTLIGKDASDADIERILSHNEFDIGRTVDMLISTTTQASHGETEDESASQVPREEEVITKERIASRVMCKYFLQSGVCMRGNDCMYSHDISQRICRFWLQGRCLAQEKCVFLHEIPGEVVSKLTVSAPKDQPKPPKIADLPALGTKRGKHSGTRPADPTPVVRSLQEVKPGPPFATSEEKVDILSTLKKRKEAGELPELRVNRGRVPIVPPRRLPWKSPEFLRNQQYVELRQSAKRLGELRNKYLQLATNAWSANDPAAAKAFSKRGQHFHQRMVDSYSEAATILWEQRLKTASEIYVDLHGLELGRAIDQLESCLDEIESNEKVEPRVAYILSSRGHFKVKHHSDQLSQHVRVFLDEHGYLYRDFGEDSTFGRVIGVDPFSSIRK